MKPLNHIERSGTRPGEYVGYLHGCQRIRKSPGGGWETYALGSASGMFVSLHASTLTKLDERIARLRAKPYISAANA